MHPSDKIAESLSILSASCEELRRSGEKLVLTSGCFDLIHSGHLDYLWEASRFGQLIVGINSDRFVREIKGNSRPIRKEDGRAYVMAGFFPVTKVVIFECDYQLIEAVKPDVYVASETSHIKIWSDQKRVALLQEMGAEIVEFGYLKKDSTTDIIRRTASCSV
jgi:rfaE bifunctional protein nucleotidyltransferase chain/domain